MKTKDIKAKAEKFLKANPDVSQVFATSDGQLFLSKNSAQFHATTNPKGKKLTVSEYGGTTEVKAAPKSKAPTKPANARKVIAAVKVEKDRAKLDGIEEAENALEKPRTSVLEAIGKRRAELTATGGEKTDADRQKDDNTQEEE